MQKITEYEFVASTHIIMDALHQVMQLNLVFQKKDLDCSVISPATKACVDELTKYKDSLLKYILLEKPSFSSLKMSMELKMKQQLQTPQDMCSSKAILKLSSKD